MNQQSIIVNYNPNFANGEASNFIQPFNKQLEIQPNAEVAFYQGQLQRKTIIIPETEVITYDLTEQLPSEAFRKNVANGTFSIIDNSRLIDAVQDIDITIRKGHYTQSELVEAIRADTSNEIETLRLQNYTADIEQDFLYQAIGENDAEGVFIGLSTLNRINNLDSTSNVGSEVTNTLSYASGSSLTGRTTVREDNWNQYLGAKFPMNPLSAIQSSSPSKMEEQQNAYFYSLNFNPVPETTQRVYVGWLNTAFTANVWVNPSIPEVQPAFPAHPVKADGVPASFFGCEYILSTDSSNVSTMRGTVYLNDAFNFQSTISEDVDNFDLQYKFALQGKNDKFDFLNRPLQRVYEFFGDEDLGVQGWRIYSITEKSGIGDADYQQSQETRKFYFQLVSKEYTSNSYNFKGGDNVLFDSRDFGISLPQDLVQDAVTWGAVKSDRDPTNSDKNVSLGIMPYIFMRNCNTGTYFHNPKGSWISQANTTGALPMINNPIQRYGLKFQAQTGVDNKGSPTYSSETSVLRQVLGLGRSYNAKTDANNNPATYDPNIYPQSRGASAGINALYSDNLRYNFEILSLPIRTFNSTKNSDNISGNERTIIHSTESFIEGEVTELRNSFINKNIVPSTLKYISLNNSARIFLNDIAVKVTRADTNQTASEITDTSFEILVRYPK